MSVNKEVFHSMQGLSMRSMDPAAGLGVEDASNIDATDDFDPLTVECVDDHVDIEVHAPPETE